EGRTVQETKRVDGTDYTTLSAFDALGRLTQLTYPADQIVKYAYDEAGRLAQVTNGDGSVSYASFPSYNALGQPLFRYQSNGTTRTSYQYHPNRLVLSRMLTETDI